MQRLRTVGSTLLAAWLQAVAGPAGAMPCFVNAAAVGANNGSSWADAYKDLQGALGTGACAEVWVAKSVYKPSAGNASVSFIVTPGAAVYGGFAGNETQRAQRDPAANLTVLSGDLANDDCGGSGCPNGVDTDATQIAGGNSSHVVVMDGTGTMPITSSTVLDGFTITAGNASSDSGGGLYCNGAVAAKSCSPTLANLMFSGNRTSFVGGALFAYAENGGASSPVLTRVTFRGNRATLDGGAIYNDGANGGTSSPLLTDVTFDANTATEWGGAMYNDGTSGGVSSPVLTGVTFSGNSAKVGGAMYDAGSGGTSSPSLTNVTFSGNSASQYGGAMFNVGDSTGVSSPTLTNVTFNGNSATQYGGAVDSYDGGSGISVPVLTNVILWGDTAGTSYPEVLGSATISKSIVQGGCPVGTSCSNLVSGDPLLGPLRNNGGPTRTLMPGFGSKAVDAASDPNCPPVDQRGIVRPLGPHCDIGAVESDLVFADNFDGTPAF